MKIVSKQIYTTVIWDDGTHCDMVKKTVSVEDTSFESMDIEDIHNIVAVALRTAINKRIDKPISSR